jgi:hypothetical protein
MSSRRTYIGVGLAVGVVALVVVWSLFRPELLFIDATVNEAPPAAVVGAQPAAATEVIEAVQPTTAPTSTDAPAQPTTDASTSDDMEQLATTTETVADPTPTIAEVTPTAIPVPPVGWMADFRTLAHETTGTANILTLEDGSHVLRLEQFMTTNGPDLRVYLVRGTDGTDDETINGGGFIDLGVLKGNIGDQNYVIPPDVDLNEFRSVSIWCRRFAVNFGGTILEG